MLFATVGSKCSGSLDTGVNTIGEGRGMLLFGKVEGGADGSLCWIPVVGEAEEVFAVGPVAGVVAVAAILAGEVVAGVEGVAAVVAGAVVIAAVVAGGAAVAGSES